MLLLGYYSAMIEQLQNSPIGRKLSRSYDALPDRDQQAVKILIIVFILCVVYFLLWAPTWGYYQDSKKARDAAVQSLNYVKANEAEAREAAKKIGSAQKKSGSDQSSISIVTSSGRKSGVEIKRFEPSGNNKLRVWLEGVPFNNLVNWLDSLEKTYDISVQEIAIDRAEQSGYINGRLTLAM